MINTRSLYQNGYKKSTTSDLFGVTMTEAPPMSTSYKMKTIIYEVRSHKTNYYLVLHCKM